MKNEAIIAGITVGGQPSPSDLDGDRFHTIVNVRGEREPGNDTAAQLAGTGVAYAAVPFTIDSVTKDDIARIRSAVDAATGPVLIHCMGGTRAAMAAAIVAAEKDGSGATGALAKAAAADYEIAGTPYGAFVEDYFRKA
jgi:uncharacterized protein (TIGR01244 family)